MSKNRLKKGFTIIELIVVIAILGVLVLLAAPKFLGYTTDAKVANVKNDIAAYENAIEKERIDDDKYIKNWEKVDVVKMNSLKNSLFTKKGLITESNNVAFGGEYYKIPEDSKLIKTSLKGDFYLGEGGEVYYYDEKLASKILGKSSANEPEQPVVEPEPEPPAPIETFKVTFKDYYGDVIETKTVEKGKVVDPPLVNIKGYTFSGWDKDLTNITSDVTTKALFSKGPTDKELGYSDADFTWVKDYSGYVGLNREIGYFKYTGTGRSTVEIPHVIQGFPMTNYHKMFASSPAEVTKVISTNKNVKYINSMFQSSQATSLDLSSFDTSNVTSMGWMFYVSKAGSINFGENFNTSKVTDMSGMFRGSQATTLDLSKFNTSKVTNMSDMFYGSQALTLDLSTFDTSKVSNMSEMFASSSAKTGYARTQTDADKFNASSNKPTALTFEVKNP